MENYIKPYVTVQIDVKENQLDSGYFKSETEEYCRKFALKIFRKYPVEDFTIARSSHYWNLFLKFPDIEENELQKMIIAMRKIKTQYSKQICCEKGLIVF